MNDESCYCPKDLIILIPLHKEYCVNNSNNPKRDKTPK